MLQYLLSHVEKPAEMCSYYLELNAALKCRVETSLLDILFFIYFLGMLHYFGVILHAVIYMLVLSAGDPVTSIMAPVVAFPLQF